MKIYTGLIKDLGCRCFYYNSGMNIPIGFVCAEIPDISSILSSKNGLSHLFVLDNYDFNKLCVLLIILSMMCDNYNFSMFNYLRSNGLCYSVNRRYIECTNRIVANLIIDVSPDKCEITKDYVVDYINNFKLIANNDNIEYAIRMIKLNDRLNIMNIEDYHDAYISFVRSRLNGVMDLYKSYDNISVDDVMDMIKDITENRLIIQYCSL